jgi:glycosyltransferase involved in cell wall biosynthesis
MTSDAPDAGSAPQPTSEAPRPRPPTLTYIIGTYPLLTTTFIDREIRTLRAWGIDINVVSIRRPHGDLSPDQAVLADATHYVLPAAAKTAVLRHHLRFLFTRPGRYLSALLDLMRHRHPSWRARLRTVAHFGLAVHVAAIISDRFPAEHLHAHFVDRAAVVALVAGRLLGLPYSATAHANDIYVEPVLLEEKLVNAAFVATCTGYNEKHLTEVAAPRSVAMALIYHGLPLVDYSPFPREEAEPLRLVAVGQLKEKKGFADLLGACTSLVDRDYDFHLEIIGEGPLRSVLEATIRERGLATHVTLRGALPHHEVVDAYRRAAIFVLPCVIAGDGDRDGIPNVILEASAMQLPVVSTRLSGIPEAVEDERSGLLVTPGASGELADALARLLDDRELRRRFGEHGRRLMEERFDVEVNVKQLYEMFVS